jgi:hypothetical protein
VFENGKWGEKKLNEITEVKDGTHDSPKYIKDGIPFVTQKNIKPYGLPFDDTKFITETDHEKFYKRSNVTYGGYSYFNDWNNLFGELPKLFQDEEELRKLWSNPQTRKVLLDKLDEAGFPKSDLLTLQKLVDMEKSDLYDVLEYVFNGDYIAITREARAKAAEVTIFALLNDRQKEFISFVLSKYIEIGVDELDQKKLPFLLTNKYQSLEDAKEILGDAANISRLFIKFQEHLYLKKIA